MKVRVGSTMMETRSEANEILSLIENGNRAEVVSLVAEQTGIKISRVIQSPETITEYIAGLLSKVKTGWNKKVDAQPERYLRHPAQKNRYGISE